METFLSSNRRALTYPNVGLRHVRGYPALPLLWSSSLHYWPCMSRGNVCYRYRIGEAVLRVPLFHVILHGTPVRHEVGLLVVKYIRSV